MSKSLVYYPTKLQL